jgi:hypothetical protein
MMSYQFADRYLRLGRLLTAGTCRNDAVARSENSAVDKMGENDRDRRAAPVVKRKKTRRLQLSGRRGSSFLARHARVKTWQERHEGEEHKEGVGETKQRSEPPTRPLPALENSGISAGEDPASDRMHSEADGFRSIPISSHHGTQHVWEVHSRKA